MVLRFFIKKKKLSIIYRKEGNNVWRISGFVCIFTDRVFSESSVCGVRLTGSWLCLEKKSIYLTELCRKLPTQYQNPIILMIFILQKLVHCTIVKAIVSFYSCLYHSLLNKRLKNKKMKPLSFFKQKSARFLDSPFNFREFHWELVVFRISQGRLVEISRGC